MILLILLVAVFGIGTQLEAAFWVLLVIAAAVVETIRCSDGSDTSGSWLGEPMAPARYLYSGPLLDDELPPSTRAPESGA